MSLIINSKIEHFNKILNSKKFLSHIFRTNKDAIKKNTDGTFLLNITYSYEDVATRYNLQLPSHVPEILLNTVRNINIVMSTTSTIIKNTEDTIIVKYSSEIKEPDFLLNIVGNTRLILYVQFSINTKDPNMTTVHFNKKFINSGEPEDDSNIIDINNNNIITNIYQQDHIKFNENLIMLSESFLGKNFVQNIAIPLINGLFNETFKFMQDKYIKRFIKYLSKKNIEIYTKK